MKMMEVSVDGELQRFCHKCTKFHPLSDFAKSNHTCVAWLAKVKSGKVGKNKKAEPKMAVNQKTGAATASAELLTATAPQDAVLAGGHVPQEDKEGQEDKERSQSQHAMAPGFFGGDVMCKHIAAPPGRGTAVNGKGLDMFRDWKDLFDVDRDGTHKVPSMYPQQQQQQQQHEQGDDITTTTDDQFFSFKPSDTNVTSHKFAFIGRQPGLVLRNFVKQE